MNTLSSSPLLGNGDYVAGQISDLGNLFVINFIYMTFYQFLLLSLFQIGRIAYR